MTFKIQYKITFILLFAGLQTTFAQKKEEDIGTKVVNVVKPYTSTISDDFIVNPRKKSNRQNVPIAN